MEAAELKTNNERLILTDETDNGVWLKRTHTSLKYTMARDTRAVTAVVGSSIAPTGLRLYKGEYAAPTKYQAHCGLCVTLSCARLPHA